MCELIITSYFELTAANMSYQSTVIGFYGFILIMLK